jgi:hypothetical protein
VRVAARDRAQVGLHGGAAERDAGVRRHGGAHGHAGDDVEGHAGPGDREGLLHHRVAGERVTGDQPHDGAAGLGRGDRGLGDLGRVPDGGGELEVGVGLTDGVLDGHRDVGVDQHEVGGGQGGARPGGEQAGVPGACTDEDDGALAGGLLA